MWLFKFYADAKEWALPIHIEFCPSFFCLNVLCLQFYWWKVTRDAELQLERIPDIQGGEEDSNNDFFLDGFDDQIIGDSH